METAMAWSKDWEDSESIAGDRRSDRRYRIQLDLRWKLIHRRKLQDSGTGRTIDLSSGGILFEAGRPLPVGLNVELSVVWPVLLQHVAPMQLAISGRIVRSAGQRTAVRITQHEFRTMGNSSEHRDHPNGMARPGNGTHGFGRS
ncbi:Type IV pilus assembly PilZ [Candidatus Sulfopaludibacter sp. SbA4]|nr:Type IV pilus assembly PilZ [Candidatus Sulfopaludibacter sp. SbA4]